METVIFSHIFRGFPLFPRENAHILSFLIWATNISRYSSSLFLSTVIPIDAIGVEPVIGTASIISHKQKIEAFLNPTLGFLPLALSSGRFIRGERFSVFFG